MYVWLLFVVLIKLWVFTVEILFIKYYCVFMCFSCIVSRYILYNNSNKRTLESSFQHPGYQKTRTRETIYCYLLKRILQQTRLIYSKYIHDYKINTCFIFYYLHSLETPIEFENLFNELKKQYFNRPYWLVIIYYSTDEDGLYGVRWLWKEITAL